MLKDVPKDMKSRFSKIFQDSELPIILGSIIENDRGLIITNNKKDWQDLLSKEYGDNSLTLLSRSAFNHNAIDTKMFKPTHRKFDDKSFKVRRIDLDIAKYIYNNKETIFKYHLTAFKSPQEFIENGIGYYALKNKTIVSIVSSFAACSKGIEIQVDTNPHYRRKGLATKIRTSLLLYCQDKGINPSWNSANETSTNLAKQLGFSVIREYTTSIKKKCN